MPSAGCAYKSGSQQYYCCLLYTSTDFADLLKLFFVNDLDFSSVDGDQAFGCEVGQRAYGIGSCHIRQIGPVSYTHLDVYKRQVVEQRDNLGADGRRREGKKEFGDLFCPQSVVFHIRSPFCWNGDGSGPFP